MRQVRVAIIGTGSSIGNHLDALHSLGDAVDLVAAVDVDEARVKAFADQNQIPHWFTNATEMLNAIHPDLVCIVTPPATHLALTLECLEAGAWVHCEKPLCASLAEFDQIEQAEARTGRYVSTVFQWRFGSAVERLRGLMHSGELGQPLVGLCQTLWYRNLAYYQVAWRGKWATEIGGPTMTLGIHLMDLFLWLMGDWSEVQAMIGTLDRPIEVEDVSMALVRFASGAMGTITNSALSPRQNSIMRLDFQRATVEVSALYRYNNTNWSYSIPDGSPDAEALQRWQNIQQDISGNHAAQLTALLSSMEKNERPLISGLEARRILEFAASLYKAAITRQAVQRGSITAADPFYYAMNGQPLATSKRVLR
ncbi:MAG: Gfo/Idh/MocA family oxidoreductase [Chloroflexota bacterium]